MKKSTEITIPFFVLNTTTKQPYTGLASNAFDVDANRDGVDDFTPINGPVELNSAKYPGWYNLVLTANETNADTILISVDVNNGMVDDIVVTLDDYTGLATSNNIDNLKNYGNNHWSTATGFATPADIPTVNEIQNGLATASDIPTVEAIQSGLAKSSELIDLEGHGDTVWATATGFATPSDIPSVSAIQDGLATSTDVSVVGNTILAHGDEFWTGGSGGATAEEVWNYIDRTLTEGGSSEITDEDINKIAHAVTIYDIVNNEEDGAPRYSIDTLIRTMSAWNRSPGHVTLLKSDGETPMNILDITEDKNGQVVEVK